MPSFPIQEQSERRGWDYRLKTVYCVGILDFKFEEDTHDTGELIHTVQLKDQNNQVFYDKLKFVYLEMPHFNKQEHELITRLDKWLYFIKHLEDFQSIPDIFRNDIFFEAFAKAEIAKYNPQERSEYEKTLKIYRDLKGIIDYAFGEGRMEGIIEGKIEANKATAKILKENGASFDLISKATDLKAKEIQDL